MYHACNRVSCSEHTCHAASLQHPHLGDPHHLNGDWLDGAVPERGLQPILAAGSSRASTQTQVGARQRLTSFTYRRAEEEEEEIQCRLSACYQYPPCLGHRHAQILALLRRPVCHKRLRLAGGSLMTRTRATSSENELKLRFHAHENVRTRFVDSTSKFCSSIQRPDLVRRYRVGRVLLLNGPPASSSACSSYIRPTQMAGSAQIWLHAGGPGGYCSTRHWLTGDTKHESSKCVGRRGEQHLPRLYHGPPSAPRISMYRFSRTSGKQVVRCPSQSSTE
jgi:hypothetical protein